MSELIYTTCNIPRRGDDPENGAELAGAVKDFEDGGGEEVEPRTPRDSDDGDAFKSDDVYDLIYKTTAELTKAGGRRPVPPSPRIFLFF